MVNADNPTGETGNPGNEEESNAKPAHEAEAQDSGAEVEEDELSALRSEVRELKDKYLRTMAEMENVRRRVERERSDLLKYGMEGFFKDFLVVLDSFDKAAPEQVEAESQDLSDFVAGMVMVKKQLMDVVCKHGLARVDSSGATFDPNLHQAIQKVEDEGVSQETVDQEFASGYTLNGRLLRPSMVSVKVPKA